MVKAFVISLLGLIVFFIISCNVEDVSQQGWTEFEIVNLAPKDSASFVFKIPESYKKNHATPNRVQVEVLQGGQKIENNNLFMRYNVTYWLGSENYQHGLSYKQYLCTGPNPCFGCAFDYYIPDDVTVHFYVEKDTIKSLKLRYQIF